MLEGNKLYRHHVGIILTSMGVNIGARGLCSESSSAPLQLPQASVSSACVVFKVQRLGLTSYFCLGDYYIVPKWT